MTEEEKRLREDVRFWKESREYWMESAEVWRDLYMELAGLKNKQREADDER